MNFPRRIICLTEETTELLYLLGQEERIVGITAYTERPVRAKQEKPKVSAFINGNIQKIKSLNPDMVIGFSDIQAELASNLIKEGLNVFIFNQRTLSEIFDSMSFLGRLVECEKQTEEFITNWKDKLNLIQKKSNEFTKKPRVFFQEWDDPIITSITWVHEIIEICGGNNIFQDRAYSKMAKDRIVSLQEIIDLDPEIILGSWCGKAMDKTWIEKNLSSSTAFQNNQVFEIDSSIILQPGPALFLEGIDTVFSYIQNFHSQANPKSE